jgi:hypothetical protein
VHAIAFADADQHLGDCRDRLAASLNPSFGVAHLFLWLVLVFIRRALIVWRAGFQTS